MILHSHKSCSMPVMRRHVLNTVIHTVHKLLIRSPTWKNTRGGRNALKADQWYLVEQGGMSLLMQVMLTDKKGKLPRWRAAFTAGPILGSHQEAEHIKGV